VVGDFEYATPEVGIRVRRVKRDLFMSQKRPFEISMPTNISTGSSTSTTEVYTRVNGVLLDQ
jgi:hypothetical protein